MKLTLYRKDKTKREIELPDDIFAQGEVIIEHEGVLYVCDEIGELVEARMVVIT
jgi:hypothetical protein